MEQRKKYQRWTYGEILVSAMGGWNYFEKQYTSFVKQLDCLLEWELKAKDNANKQ